MWFTENEIVLDCIKVNFYDLGSKITSWRAFFRVPLTFLRGRATHAVDQNHQFNLNYNPCNKVWKVSGNRVLQTVDVLCNSKVASNVGIEFQNAVVASFEHLRTCGEYIFRQMLNKLICTKKIIRNVQKYNLMWLCYANVEKKLFIGKHFKPNT